MDADAGGAERTRRVGTTKGHESTRMNSSCLWPGSGDPGLCRNRDGQRRPGTRPGSPRIPPIARIKPPGTSRSSVQNSGALQARRSRSARGNYGSIQTRIRLLDSLFMRRLRLFAAHPVWPPKGSKFTGFNPSSVTSVCSCSPARALRPLPNLPFTAPRVQDERTRCGSCWWCRFNVRRPARGCARW